MRDLRKTALWLGLIGSASLLSLSAMAQTMTSDSPDVSRPVPVQNPAVPSLHNVAAQPASTQENSALEAIPLPEPAPVVLETVDLKPEPAIDIPLPDAAPVTALMQQ
ncbi:MAG TPA: murein L,D-transpeptidase, partial [Microvirga sp.]|nr:murein L,D-transpeptidase [Microvirga sp.]